MYNEFLEKIKRISLFFCFIVLFWFSTHTITGLELIKNQMPSSGNDSARVIKLKKLAVAHDDTGNFIFKRPRNIIGVEDGSFFLIDNGKVLKFSANGRFLITVVAKGEGPGEATYLHQIFKRDDELIVNTGFMRKLMVFDFNGELKGEFKEKKINKKKFKGLGYSEIVYDIVAHRQDKSFIVLSPSLFHIKKEKTRKDGVFLISEKNVWQEKLFEIPIDSILLNVNGEKFMLEKISLIHVCDRQYLFFSNTERYEIKKYNISENKIEAILKREYIPVLIPEDLKDKVQYGATFKSGSKNGKTQVIKTPKPKYFRDINQLFIVNSHVWVMTSTFEKKRGILIDVYNREGEYIDKFYLSFPDMSNESIMISKGIYIFKNHLFKIETDEEGNYLVVKYGILDNIKGFIGN